MSIDATRSTWKLQEITAIQKIILLSLADRAGENGECWPSIKRIMADTNLERRAVIDNRNILMEKGYIVYTGEYKGRSGQIPVMRLTYIDTREEPVTKYEESFTSASNAPVSENNKCTGASCAPVPVHMAHQSPVHLAHPESKRIEPTKEPKIYITETHVADAQNISDYEVCEVQEVIKKAQKCLENTKANLPSAVGQIKTPEYRETNYPASSKTKTIDALQKINRLNLTAEFLMDFMDVRKANGASNTLRALKAAYKELEILYHSGHDIDKCLDIYANNQWRGFNAQWIINAMYKDNKKSSNDRHQHDWSVDWIKKCDLTKQNKD